MKVFLVEDEIVIRNAIKNSIDWETEGYRFVGEASDGELAYPLIMKERPDILITDIKMPFMNGLELSRLVKQKLPDIKILILSGYDDFEYAKEAIQIGVADYLLKPVSSEKLLEVLQKLSVNIKQERQEKELEVQDFGGVGKSREMIEQFLNSGTKEELEGFVDSYLEVHSDSGLRSTLMRQYIIMDIYIVTVSFCEKLSNADDELETKLETLKNSIHKLNSLEEIRQYMIGLFGMAIGVRDSISGKRYSDVILTAQKIILEQYMTEDISLNSVAGRVGMSPSYFSSIFSKEVGKTFVEYLTETRMNKAKELLMCSALKTSEIGYEVGYKDPHYFSYMFKKTQGCSPKEYRTRGRD